MKSLVTLMVGIFLIFLYSFNLQLRGTNSIEPSPPRSSAEIFLASSVTNRGIVYLLLFGFELFHDAPYQGHSHSLLAELDFKLAWQFVRLLFKESDYGKRFFPLATDFINCNAVCSEITQYVRVLRSRLICFLFVCHRN